MNEWPNDLCEPVIITYNRATELNKTLAVFAKLQSKNMILHVLDNASTDDTAKIVQTWQQDWPGLRYHCNPYNIGGNGNILRAIELSSTPYSWVIGDDDVWHLEYIDEVIQVLRQQECDIIRLGWLVTEDVAGQTLSAKHLFHHQPFFFASLSMISATITRRAIMAKHLNWAYQNICYSYPQLVPIIRAYQEQTLLVHNVKNALMTHTPSQAPGYFLGDLEWYVAWFQTSRYFNEERDQQRFIAEAVAYMIRPQEGKLQEWIWLLKVIFNAKAQGVSQWRYLLQLWMLGKGWRLRLFYLLVVYGLFPGRLARGLRRGYFFLKKKAWKELQYDRSRF